MKPDIRKAEELELFVPLSPAEVEARLREVTGSIPGWVGPGTFWGRVGDGSFRLHLKRFRRRNLRPALSGTYEAVPGGTRIRATAASATWARPLGRALSLLSAGIGAGLAGTALLGLPDADPTLRYAMFGLAGWSVVLSVLVPGFLVVEATEERGLLGEALRAALPGSVAVADDALAEPEAPPSSRRTAPPRVTEG